MLGGAGAVQEGKSSTGVRESWKRAHLEVLLLEIQRKPPAPSARRDGKEVEGGEAAGQGEALTTGMQLPMMCPPGRRPLLQALRCRRVRWRSSATRACRWAPGVLARRCTLTLARSPVGAVHTGARSLLLGLCSSGSTGMKDCGAEIRAASVTAPSPPWQSPPPGLKETGGHRCR